MFFKATTQRGVLLISLITWLLILIRSKDEYLLLTGISILLALFSIIGLCIRYEFIIELDELKYRILFSSHLIYEKRANVADIEEILFKRFGWATRGAIVKLHKGLNMRIYLFSPNDVVLHLENFSLNNRVAISKSKVYLLLEKMTR